MAKRVRHGRILLDYFRNHRGATAVAAYSTRGRPYATVSTPLEWSELERPIYPEDFTLATIRERLTRAGDPLEERRDAVG